jgi:hypothetical protein
LSQRVMSRRSRALQVGPERPREDLRQVPGVLVHERPADDRKHIRALQM